MARWTSMLASAIDSMLPLDLRASQSLPGGGRIIGGINNNSNTLGRNSSSIKNNRQHNRGATKRGSGFNSGTGSSSSVNLPMDDERAELLSNVDGDIGNESIGDTINNSESQNVPNHSGSFNIWNLHHYVISLVLRSIHSILFNSVADRLPYPFHPIALHPFLSIGGTAVVYLIFLIIYVPLYFASFLFTGFGSFILLLLGLHLLAQSVASSIAYPGSTSALKSDISKDYLRRILHTAFGLTMGTSNLAASATLVISGKLSRVETTRVIRFARELSHSMKFATELSKWVSMSIDELIRLQMIQNRSKEAETFQSLKTHLETFYTTTTAFIAQFIQFCESNNNNSGLNINLNNNTNTNNNTNNTNNTANVKNQLISMAGKCAQSADKLRNFLSDFKPKDSNEDSRSSWFDIFGIASRLFNKKMGNEMISFSIMRSVLLTKLGTIRLQVKCANGNKIDGMIFPKHCFDRSSMNIDNSKGSTSTNTSSPSSTPSSTPSSSSTASGSQTSSNHHQISSISNFTASEVGMVLFLCPNAAMYESLSMAQVDSSWVGFYTRLGLDVVVVNYRGYGVSEGGSPSPNTVKSDMETVVRYIRETPQLRPKRLILHGESIGGMAACHLAAKLGADALVCDRTFSSLDATASRLMSPLLGWCLRFLAMWHSQTIRDFTEVTCPKIVLQDPLDEIIAYPASLLAGVSLNLALGDTVFEVKSLPSVYTLAFVCGLDVPNRHMEPEIIQDVLGSHGSSGSDSSTNNHNDNNNTNIMYNNNINNNNNNNSGGIGNTNSHNPISATNKPDDHVLTERFVSHFTACLKHIYMCAKFESVFRSGNHGNNLMANYADINNGGSGSSGVCGVGGSVGDENTNPGTSSNLDLGLYAHSEDVNDGVAMATTLANLINEIRHDGFPFPSDGNDNGDAESGFGDEYDDSTNGVGDRRTHNQPNNVHPSSSSSSSSYLQFHDDISMYPDSIHRDWVHSFCDQNIAYDGVGVNGVGDHQSSMSTSPNPSHQTQSPVPLSSPKAINRDEPLSTTSTSTSTSSGNTSGNLANPTSSPTMTSGNKDMSTGSHLGIFHRLWISLARLHNRCGQLLGQSLRIHTAVFDPEAPGSMVMRLAAQEYDLVRVWLATFMVYGNGVDTNTSRSHPHHSHHHHHHSHHHHSHHDSTSGINSFNGINKPRGASTLDECIRDVEYLISCYRVLVQGNESDSDLKVFDDCLGQYDHHDHHGSQGYPSHCNHHQHHHGNSNSTHHRSIHISDRHMTEFRQLMNFSMKHRKQLNIYRKTNMSKDLASKTKNGISLHLFPSMETAIVSVHFLLKSLKAISKRLHDNGSVLSRNKGSLMFRSTNIGRVLPLSSGHNGWLSSMELAKFREFIVGQVLSDEHDDDRDVIETVA